jgi:alkylation response protein AidB-like acyl-CoA dehydrogenase
MALTLDDVLDHVAARSAEFTELRHVPRDMVEEFKEIGVYRAATPRRFGGDPLPPAEFLRIIERISAADGSAGWVAGFGSANTYLAALPLETQAEIYAAGPDVTFAGGLFPVQAAEPAPGPEGGQLVRGTWKFASGCKGADLLGVGIRPRAADGGGRVGRPQTAVLRPSQVEIVENWDVLGMEGTGSHDLRVDGVAVPDEWVFVRGGEATVDEPLYRYPTLPYASQVLAVVGLGIGRAALDHAIRTGAGRKGLTGAPKPADRAYYRIGVGRAEAELRSARAFFYEATEESWASVLSDGQVTDRQYGLLRLAAAHAAAAGFTAAQAAYRLSGTAAIDRAHPLQRLLRDASVPPQHAFLTEGMYDGAGAALMNVPPFPGF